MAIWQRRPQLLSWTERHADTALLKNQVEDVICEDNDTNSRIYGQAYGDSS